MTAIRMSQPAEPRTLAIARIWRGRTRPALADAYEAYNFEVGIKPLLGKAAAVQTFREDRETESEFVTISYWESLDAITSFSGGDPTAVHHLPRDAEFLLELPASVQILQLRVDEGAIGRPRRPAARSGGDHG